MFQTEPIICLQHLGNQFFTHLMQQVTQMGYPSLIVPIIVIAIFGIDFKKSFLLFQLFMWTDLVTDILKILVGFPRPYYVDKKVINLENNITSTSSFSGNEIKGIFAIPDNQILNTFHLQEAYKSGSLGFPSGHVSLTTALWGGSATVFDNRLIKILTPLAMILMAFSRVYLGKHFIGDVIGGAIVGLISIVVFAYFLKSSLKQGFFKKESFELAFRRENLFFYCFMFVIPVILIAFSLIGSHPLNTDTGYLLGMNVAYLFIIRKGIPDDTGTAERRATRIFIALLLFEVSKIILNCGFCTNYLFAIEFLKTFIPASTIWVSVVICKKFNLYRRNEESL